MFYIVSFPDENSVEVVPESWILKDELCAWPTFKEQDKIRRAIKKNTEPGSDWLKVKGKILWATESYEEAIKKARKATDETDLNSEREGDTDNRKRTKRKPLRFSSDDDSDNEPLIRRSSELRLQFAKTPPPPGITSGTSGEIASTSKEVASPAPPHPPNTQEVALLENSQNITPKRTPRQLEDLGYLSDLTTRELLIKSIGFQLRILKVLEGVRLQSEAQTRTLKEFPLRNVEPARDITGIDLPELPICTLQEVETLEESLKTPAICQRLIDYLGTTGGTSVEDTTRRILLRVMSNSLAMAFSYTGRKGKRSFQTLKLKGVLFGAVRQHAVAKSATDHELCVAVGNWLRYAPERCGVKRKKPNASLENQEQQNADS